MGEVMTQEEVKYLLKRYSQHLSAAGAFGKAPAAHVKRGEIFMAGGEGERGVKGGFDKVRQICTKLDEVRK